MVVVFLFSLYEIIGGLNGEIEVDELAEAIYGTESAVIP
jgi:hypothetical protein